MLRDQNDEKKNNNKQWQFWCETKLRNSIFMSITASLSMQVDEFIRLLSVTLLVEKFIS